MIRSVLLAIAVAPLIVGLVASIIGEAGLALLAWPS